MKGLDVQCCQARSRKHEAVASPCRGRAMRAAEARTAVYPTLASRHAPRPFRTHKALRVDGKLDGMKGLTYSSTLRLTHDDFMSMTLSHILAGGGLILPLPTGTAAAAANVAPSAGS